MKSLVLTHPGMILLSKERDFSFVGSKIIQTNSEKYKVDQEVGVFASAPIEEIPLGILVKEEFVYGIYFDKEATS